MDHTQLVSLVNRLRNEPHETEWLEFKENHYEPQLLGEYLSALANSAYLHWKPKGYLVFGIEDKTHEVKGTRFNPAKKKGKGNQALQIWLAIGLQPNVGFDVHRFPYHDKYVVVFEVNAAIDRPVAFYGTAYIRIGSSKTELFKHPEKEREIWSRRNRHDWSAQICRDATLDDLDPEAIQFARKQYKEKQPGQAQELDQWDDLTFLNKAKVCISGQLTHAALLLLGKEESGHFLSQAIAQLSWVLRNDQGIEKDYEHFGLPLILAVDRIFAKLRILTYRYMPNASLFPVEVKQYDTWVIRESLHNAIAHQDYTKAGRINIIEEPESLLVTNLGRFIPGSVEEVIRRDAPPERYRNPFLARAMVNLSMIDTIGSGIKRMFLKQRQRFFPMPDYDLSEPERVRVRIFGKILDENYTRLLIEKADLNLLDVMALDKVQKHHQINEEEFKRLKKQKLIEGRRPNLFVSARVAAVTGDKADYIKQRAFDKKHYKKMVVSYLKKFGEAKREDIDKLLLDKISDVLDEKQKRNRIRNLLFEMSHKDNTIFATGPRRTATWVLRH